MIRALALILALLLFPMSVGESVAFFPRGGGSPGCTFVNTRAGAFSTWSVLFASQRVNDTLTVTGICTNQSIGGGFQNGVTINSVGNINYNGGNSEGVFDIFQTGITLNGGTINGPVRVRDHAANFTLENATINGYVGTCASRGTSCFLTGAFDGAVKLTNVLVFGGGDAADFGQDHNVYISADAGLNDTSAVALITNLTSLNVIDGGWTLKMRPAGVNTQNHVTQSVIGCTVPGRGCEQNGVVDMPCSGNYLIDYSVLERGPGGDNGYVIRSAEENRNGTTQCPASFAPRNSLTVDHDIIIWDGPSPGWSVTNVACIAANDGAGNCEKGRVPTGQTYALTNSVIIGDSASSVMPVAGTGVGSGAGCTLVAGKCTDANNNRWYNNRTTASANEGWSGNFTDPTTGTVYPCCAFPWLPPHP
jgi:hypothetical protein